MVRIMEVQLCAQSIKMIKTLPKNSWPMILLTTILFKIFENIISNIWTNSKKYNIIVLNRHFSLWNVLQNAVDTSFK